MQTEKMQVDQGKVLKKKKCAVQYFSKMDACACSRG